MVEWWVYLWCLYFSVFVEYFFLEYRCDQGSKGMIIDCLWEGKDRLMATIIIIVIVVIIIVIVVIIIIMMIVIINIIHRKWRSGACFSNVPKLFRWHKSLCIFKMKVSRVTKICSYLSVYSLYNIWKDQLYRISGSEFYEWVFRPVKFSGLLRNACQVTKTTLCLPEQPNPRRMTNPVASSIHNQAASARASKGISKIK